VDIQSYAKFSAMSDALNATGAPIVFSYEPHLTAPIGWTRYVGNAWRTGHDIGSQFSSMFSDLAINNAWASVAGVGGWNDAVSGRHCKPRNRMHATGHRDLPMHGFTYAAFRCTNYLKFTGLTQNLGQL
jgi:hypothetical protein